MAAASAKSSASDRSIAYQLASNGKNAFFRRAVKITQGLKEKCGPKLKDFKALLDENETPDEIKQLKKDVEEFAMQFPTIGFERGDMRYSD